MTEVTINGVVYKSNGEPLTEEEFSKMFIEWLESQGLSFGGVIVNAGEDDEAYEVIK